MQNLSFRQLRAIVAVDRLGRINLAARALGLTAPAVTLQVQQAEEAAGIVLFERRLEGFRTTDAGRAFVAAAKDIDRRLMLLDDEILAIKGAGQGSLRLGAVSTAKYFVPRLIGGFAEVHPGISLRLTIGNRAAIIDALNDQEIDFALMGRPPRQADVKTALIGHHPLVIIAAPDHPLAGEAKIGKARLAGETFFVREQGSGTRMSFELFLGDIPGRRDTLDAEFGSNETIKQAVMAGMGLAFISAHTIALEVELGRLAVLDVVGMPVIRQWFVVSRADRLTSPAMAAFKAFAVTRGESFLPVLGGSPEP